MSKKLVVKSMCTALIVTLMFSMLTFQVQCENISSEVFRLHILANSDEEYDQNLKLAVRDEVIKYTDILYNNIESKQQAMDVTEKNLEKIKSIVLKKVHSMGYNYSVTVSVKNMYFNTRYYDDVTMPGGFYDALQIKIGSAEGKNWWCVMYPALCVGSAANKDALKDSLNDEEIKIVTSEGKYVFRFKIVEIYEKLKELFSV